MTPDFGYGQFSEVVFYRTYSRIKTDGTMETWNDVVIRVTEGVFTIRKDWYIKTGIAWDEDFWTTYARGFAVSMFNMQWLPPGRGLWAMGTDFIYERGSMALNNCGFANITDDIGSCANWVMDALMCGVGVGFAPLRNDSFEMHYSWGTYTFVVPDTREGWCAATQLLIDSYCKPGLMKPTFDYSQVRKAGLSIKGFGGISSGPEPLIKLHQRIDTYFEMYDELDWYDTVLLKSDIINAIGCCVVAGNVRRSAEICLGSINDQVFLDLKNYEKYPHRAEIGWISNNSAILDVNEDYEKLGEISRRVIKNAEPGILNRQNVKHGRLGKYKDKIREDKATGINPCLKGSSLVITKEGIRQLDDVCVGESIWSETGWTRITAKWSNGYKDIYRWHTTVGHIDLTDNHRIVSNGEKIEIIDADRIDRLDGPTTLSNVSHNPVAVMDGLVLGDGTTHEGHTLLNIGQDDQSYFESEIKVLIHQKYNKDYQYIVDTGFKYLPRTFERSIPDKYVQETPNNVASFLRGLFSANGSFVGGTRITLKSSSRDVIVTASKMLSSLGIASYYTTNKEHVVEFENGDFVCKESYDLNITRQDNIRYFMKIIGFIQPYKNAKVYDALSILDKKDKRYSQDTKKRAYEIHTVEFLINEEVFDITVDNYTHTFWCDGFNVSNCGEQPLEDRELCTLVETLPTRCEDGQNWLKACEYATLYASTVTLLPTHRPDTNAVMLRNRRIGVGIIDYSGWKHDIGLNQVIKYLRLGYDRIRYVNHWCQSEAGVPDSIRVTTCKPGGTVPKIAGRTAGIGHPNFHHTLRRMRIAVDSPMVPLLIESGIPYERDVVSDNTYVFEFPILQGPAKPATQVSMWEQIVNVVTVQREWSDNAVSNTITFIPEWEVAFLRPMNPDNLLAAKLELEQFAINNVESKMLIDDYQNIVIKVRNPHHEEDDIEHALAAHASSIKSLSLLPASSRGCYAQMPEEGLTEDAYNLRLSMIKKIDWTRLRHSVAEPEKYCTGEACEVPAK